MNKGARCMVEGCRRIGLVLVVFPDLADEGYVEPLPAQCEPLVVCDEHAEQLGEIAYTLDGDHTSWVVIDPARSEGWRITIACRPSGRWVTVLLPPGAPHPAEPTFMP